MLHKFAAREQLKGSGLFLQRSAVTRLYIDLLTVMLGVLANIMHYIDAILSGK